jgi:DNA-binding XRE family transcriptional regulator
LRAQAYAELGDFILTATEQGLGPDSLLSDERDNRSEGEPVSGRRRSRRIGAGVSVRQIKAARALLGWTQKDLANYAGVAAPTVARIEAVEGELRASGHTAARILRAFRAAGILFASDADGEAVTTSPTVLTSTAVRLA